MAIRKIALTGGIATGKTYVATRLREAGVPIVDADVLAREVVALGTPALTAVRQRFGPDVIRRDGTMDRIRVGQIIFKDKRARQDLEAIIHPAVQKAIDKYFATLPKKTPFAVADIPLLDAAVSQTIFAPRGKHSAKPPETRDRIVRLYGDRPRIELFARERVDGWDAWGDQCGP